jgi:hypothetical protein
VQHISSRNFDDLPTFNDIWAKIFDPYYLELLTDAPAGRQRIRIVEQEQVWGDFSLPNVTDVFRKETKVDETSVDTFKAYMLSQKKAYKNQLSVQQVETQKRLAYEKEIKEKL